ncbi:MAG: mechanosensitive ion channel domain-containing protein, partial [Bacteroidota bacterium]
MKGFIGTLWSNYPTAISIALIIFGALGLARLSRWLLQRSLNRLFKGDPSGTTAVNFLKNTVSIFFFLVALIGIVYTIPALRSLAETLTIGAGVLAAIFAFASQAAFSNLIGGVFIVLFHPFRVGDRISINRDYEGTVEDITLRHTVIRDWEQRRIVIPNSVISKETIINHDIASSIITRFMEVPISYESDFELAKQIIIEHGTRHPLFRDLRTEQEKAEGEALLAVKIIRYSDSGAIFRVYLKGEFAETFAIACDLRLSLSKAFK